MGATITRPLADNEPLTEWTKQDFEIQRYKQDCRKRALDLAQARISAMKEPFDHVKDAITGKLIPEDKVSETLLMSLADKYYNWLINIPQ